MSPLSVRIHCVLNKYRERELEQEPQSFQATLTGWHINKAIKAALPPL